MRRGRPGLGLYFREEIIAVLGALQYPVTINTLRTSLRQCRGSKCSWNTIRKYLHQLCQEGIVYRQVLPTERGRKPLVVYFLRGS